MKIAALSYATDQGLGILAKSFVDAGVVTDFMVIKHDKRHNHMEWYPNAPFTENHKLDKAKLRAFLREMDVFLIFETPFDWELIPFCREHGVKTVLMPMYECEPKELPYQPDKFICPSLLDLDYYPDRSQFIPVPVQVPWRLRREAKVFVHNAGNLGLRGRNGTEELLEAIPHVRSPIKLILRYQKDGKHIDCRDARVEIRRGTVPYADLWKDGGEGDVFLFGERFNGLSLPLQEACAAGMLVMGSNRYPMNTWLANDPLIPVTGYRRAQVSGRCNFFDEAIISPKDIAATIDAWYGRDITELSQRGWTWARSMSWDALKPRYTAFLEAACAE